MERINLQLPTSYNRCTPAQLRAIAAIMADRGLHTSRLHPYDHFEVKVAVFFRLTGIEVVEPVNPRVNVEDQYYTCRQTPWTLEEENSRWFRMLRWYRSFKAWFRRSVLGHDDTFSLYLWQINYWLTPHKNLINGKDIPGMLDWLDADSRDHLLRFPFPTVYRRRQSSWFSIDKKVEFHGPSPFMDGFIWRRYRFAQDYMQVYVDCHNALLQMQQQGNKVSADDMLKAVKNYDLAKAMFLAVLYNSRITYVDEETGCKKTDFHYQSNQHSDNSPYFRNFPESDFQLILLWWQGMMHFLQKTYPKVFKKTSVKSPKKPVNPLELYTRTTATMEKYLHITASDVDREPYTTILQQLEDITRRNEEIEKMNAKMKSRRK